MKEISITSLKADFEDLIEKASAGDAFIVTKSGKPVAKVLPVEANDLRTEGHNLDLGQPGQGNS